MSLPSASWCFEKHFEMLSAFFEAYSKVIVAWVGSRSKGQVLQGQHSWFDALLAVAIAASALQVSASFPEGWLPSWEHCKASTYLYRPYKRRVYVPYEDRSQKRLRGWKAWRA